MKLNTLRMRFVSLLAALFALFAGLTAQSSPELPDPGSPQLSRQQQEQLGLQAGGEVYKQMPVLPDSNPVTQYVQELGRRLVSVVPQQYSWPYQFHVVAQKEVNAFALPGGPIFINIGTIQTAANEAELAGVISHEMSHIYMQHSAKAMPKQEMAQVFAGILGAVLPGSTAGNLARLGIQFGAGTILMKYSRTDEAQADAVGAIIMYKAGYNPRALADFFKTLEQQAAGGNGPQFLSDHPNPGNREEAISNEIKGWPPENYRGDSSGFVSCKRDAAGLKSYTAKEIAAGAQQGLWARYNQQNGAIFSNGQSAIGSGDNTGPVAGAISDVSFQQIQPSKRFTSFQQNDFSIAYPRNWQATTNAGGATIAPPAGVSGSSIAYGAMIGEARSQRQQSLDQATAELIQGLQQSNPGLQTAGNFSSASIKGAQSRAGYLIGLSPIQRNGHALPERDWLVTVQLSPTSLLYLIFVAPERDFNQLRPTYQKMVKSLQIQ